MTYITGGKDLLILLLFKVDFLKSYYSVDWRCLEDDMVKMKFLTLWHKQILECITANSAFVLVNGSMTEEFKMEKGLRQGDLFFWLRQKG